MPVVLAMQDGGKKDYSPVPAVIHSSSFVSTDSHLLEAHFSRDRGYYILLIKGGIASGSVHTYIFSAQF